MALPADLDYSDPCAVAESLRKALVQLAAGEKLALIEFEVGTGTRRKMEYHKGDIPVLRELLADAESKCRAAQGGAGRVKTVKFQTSRGL